MEVKKLAEEHWAYTKGVLVYSGVATDTLDLIHFIYTQALTHGYKHGKGDCAPPSRGRDNE